MNRLLEFPLRSAWPPLDGSPAAYTPSARAPGAFTVNHHTGEMSWSHKMKQLFGLPGGEPVDWEFFWQRLHSDDRRAVIAAITGSLDPKGPGRFSLEHRILRTDGELRWIRVEARTLFISTDDQFYPLQTIGVVRDITARKLGEDDLTGDTIGRPLDRPLGQQLGRRPAMMLAEHDCLASG